MLTASPRRFRGKNKAPKWKKSDAGRVSVMVLPLAVTDPADLARLGKLFGAMWSIKRVVQRDARARVDAFWASKHERDRDGTKAVRQRLGLSREALERCAYKHLEDAGHLKHHASKALAMHMADEVWNGVQRHLFPDATGQRHGRPKTGIWHDFTRIPGRARSHMAVPAPTPPPTSGRPSASSVLFTVTSWPTPTPAGTPWPSPAGCRNRPCRPSSCPPAS